MLRMAPQVPSPLQPILLDVNLCVRVPSTSSFAPARGIAARRRAHVLLRSNLSDEEVDSTKDAQVNEPKEGGQIQEKISQLPQPNKRKEVPMFGGGGGRGPPGRPSPGKLLAGHGEEDGVHLCCGLSGCVVLSRIG